MTRYALLSRHELVNSIIDNTNTETKIHREKLSPERTIIIVIRLSTF